MLCFPNSFKSFTNDLSETQIRELVESALKVWSDVTPLKFREISRSATADIEISFPRLDHGDGYPLDGRGGTLAHAFFPGPGIGGDAHFDDDEIFLYNTDVDGKTILLSTIHCAYRLQMVAGDLLETYEQCGFLYLDQSVSHAKTDLNDLQLAKLEKSIPHMPLP